VSHSPRRLGLGGEVMFEQVEQSLAALAVYAP